MTVYGVQSLTYSPKVAPGTPPEQAQDPQSQEMDFLQLLVSEVSNQTPDSPMDPTAMITQYSQMQAAIGLTKLTDSSRTYQNSSLAANLLHQSVTIATGNASAPIRGTVSAVDFSGNSPQVEINGTYYPISSVLHIGA